MLINFDRYYIKITPLKLPICFFILLYLGFSAAGSAQWPDSVIHPNIKTVKLFKSGDAYSYPVIMLGSNEQLELHFDDMDADVKFYYYSFQLCNADWKPAQVQSFDYIRGFQSNRISTYRSSSITGVRYTHYQLFFPDKSLVPAKGGNYLLKVFLNDDTSKLVFTKRFLVVNPKASVSGLVAQPFSGATFQTHQLLRVNVAVQQGQISIFSPQDMKLLMVQNYDWATSVTADRPTVYRGNYYEYSDEDLTVFPGGKEWRWIDLRSLRLRSDRMQKIEDNDSNSRVDVYVNPDADRRQQVYLYYRDANGLYSIENRDQANPWWQSDYAWVHFTFLPPGKKEMEGKELHLYGELTGYRRDENSRMTFNEEKGVYEKSLYLKQGFYNYNYVLKSPNPNGNSGIENADGNYWGTENVYMLLLYYRPFGGRADELVGFTKISSNFQR